MILRWFRQRRALRAAQARYVAGWEWSSRQLSRGASSQVVAGQLQNLPPDRPTFDPWLLGAVDRLKAQEEVEREQR